MLRVLFLMLILLAGLISGPYIAGNQGYVLIETGSHSIEMSITTLVVFFVIAMALVYGLEWCVTRFLRLSTNTYSWFSRRKRKKAQQQTLEGLLHMDAGDYTKAERLIGKNAKHSAEPVLNFIKAAEAAQQHGDEFSANKYLMQATEFAGTDNLVVEIARTRILLRQNKLPAARSSVDSLLVMAPRNIEVLKLAVEIYLKSKAYAALEQVFETIEKTEIFSAKELTALQRRVDDGLLDEKMNEEGQEGLLNWWESLPRKRRQDTYLKVGLVKRLIECNDHESAHEIALELLKKTDDNSVEIQELLTALTHLQPSDSSKLVKGLERKVSSANKEMQYRINRALGYLYVRSGLFEKAAKVFRDLVSDVEHMDLNDANMAIYVFEQINDSAQAAKVREGALKRAMATTELKEVRSDVEVLEKPTALLEESK